MSEHLKNLVKEIQKLAQVPGRSKGDRQAPAPAPAPAAGTPTPPSTSNVPQRGSKPSGGGTATVRKGNPEIIKMQESIVALAREVTSQLNTQNLSAPDPRKKQEAGGRDSFADFLTKHFMRNSDVQAVEFSPDPTKNKMEDKDPRIASKLSWVMDTMSRVGGHTNEFKVDGFWGPRTAAAITNVCAMTEGLFALADAFNVHLTSYYKKDFAQFKEKYGKDSDHFSISEKIDWASDVIIRLNAIRKMYMELKSKVLQNPQYQTYIENDTPYLQHTKPDVGFTPTPEQLAVMKKAFPNGFDVYLDTTDKGGRVSAKLDVDNLASPEAFKEWMRSRGVAKDVGEVLKQVTDQVGGA